MSEEQEEQREPAEQGAPVEEDIESLRQALAEEREKAEKYLANWQRAQADFSNLKKRSEQERAEIMKFANATLVLDLLPILDDFERALDNVSAKLAGFTWVDGVRLIHRKLQAVLEAHGLSSIEALGQDFDPTVHEAVLRDEGEEGKVIDELQRGYKLHDRVLRPSMVKVGEGKKGETEEEMQQEGQ